MAKKKTTGNAPLDAGNPQPSNGEAGTESTAGYFRKIFLAKPALLRKRSNDKLLKMWLADHPGASEVPKTVKQSLAKVKGVMRSKKRKRVARRAEDSQPVSQQPKVHVARVATGSSKLEALELQIDECLILARLQDREALHDVISMLRRARNAVVWKLGQ